MQAGAGQAVNVEAALQAMNITKQFSRDLLSRSLPVPDATLAAHQKALAALAAKARQARLQARAPRAESPQGGRRAVRGAGARCLPCLLCPGLPCHRAAAAQACGRRPGAAPVFSEHEHVLRAGLCAVACLRCARPARPVT